MAETYGYAVMVIAPVSVKTSWLRAAKNVGVEIEVFSWGKLPKPLETRKYVVIADEAHYAQAGVESQRGAALLELCGHNNCEAAWMLSGTPMTNGRPKNLFPLLVAVGARSLSDRWEYERRYCGLQHNGFSWDNTGATNLDELAKVTERFVLRRTKGEVLTLPGKQRVTVAAGLSNTAQAAYNTALAKAVEEYRDRALSGEVSADAEALAMLTKARSLASNFKVSHTVQMVEELLEQGQQVVIFTEFIESANKLHEKLGGALMSSDLSSEARQKLVDDFQSGKHRVFITTIRCGGVGITLTAASTVVMHDRGWTPEGVEQAEDRCNRLGQTKTVLSYWVQLGRVDEIYDERIDAKAAIATAVLKGKGLKIPKDASIRQIAETLFGRGKKHRS
jgi:SNF2 family DNA or RNA helicase